ncbi:MAG: ATP-binding cassette domain-containing protein, partial [Novibacillus thermophilus]
PPTYLQNLLEELALTEYEHVLIKNMSLGTQQKVAIVTAYLDEPQLILMDEPFVNFDQKSLKVVLRFIRDYLLQKQAITIFSTHSQDHRIQQVITHNLHIKDARTITVTEIRKDRDVRDVFV